MDAAAHVMTHEPVSVMTHEAVYVMTHEAVYYSEYTRAPIF